MKLSSRCTLILLTALAGTLCAQSSGQFNLQPSVLISELAPATDPSSPLPNAPTPTSALNRTLTGTITGQVHYSDGSPTGNAQLTLVPATGAPLQTTTNAGGGYAFIEVPPGAFTIQVTADGFEPSSTQGSLPQSAALDLPPISLQLAALVTSINAISQEQEAEIEVRGEEQQRLFGAIPNFFIVYGGEAVPLSAKQKFRLSTRTLLDPTTIAISAAIAGGEQASGSYSGFGNGAAGYARRFGASFGDATTGIMLTGALLPSIFHQDPRYFYKGTGSVPSRVGYVLKNTVEQKGDNGRWQFGWSNILGNVGSALISNTYYPNQSDKWVTLTGENFGLSIAGQGIANLLQEFVFARLTTHRQP